MNKREFINSLANELTYSHDECIIINDILESHFIIGRKNKEKIITDLMSKLKVDRIEAEKIYELATSILSHEIKNKLKHPFRSQD